MVVKLCSSLAGILCTKEKIKHMSNIYTSTSTSTHTPHTCTHMHTHTHAHTHTQIDILHFYLLLLVRWVLPVATGYLPDFPLGQLSLHWQQLHHCPVGVAQRRGHVQEEGPCAVEIIHPKWKHTYFSFVRNKPSIEIINILLLDQFVIHLCA